MICCVDRYVSVRYQYLLFAQVWICVTSFSVVLTGVDLRDIILCCIDKCGSA